MIAAGAASAHRVAAQVDDALAPGLGHRLDGWANRDLDVGKIVALAPDPTAFSTLLGVPAASVRTVLQSWGPGKAHGDR